MPIIYCIDHERRLVQAHGYGAFTDDDVFVYQRSAWSRRDVAGFNELVDMTLVTDIVLPSVHRVHDLAMKAADMDHQVPSRLAIVAPGDLAYGMGRMYEAYRELDKDSTKEVGVFRTLTEALAFLKDGDPPPTVLPGETAQAR